MTLEYLELCEDMKKRQETNEVPRRVRGSLLVRGDDSYEFTPYAEGESTQEVLKQKGKSKIYRTKGKTPQMVAYLSVPGDSPDPAAAIMDAAAEMTSDMRHTEAKLIAGIVLTDDPELRIAFDREKRQLQVVMNIDLTQTPAYNNRLIYLMQRTSQCFAINQTSLARPKQ